jgi:hypothetical protein
MSDGNLFHEGLVDIDRRTVDLLAKTSDLADHLEVVDLARLIAIDDKTRRVVPAVFLAGEPSNKDVKDVFSALSKHKVNALSPRCQTTPK